MRATEYSAALKVLDWTHDDAARFLGISRRTSIRYKLKYTTINEPAARLLRLLVNVRLTSGDRAFERMVEGL